MRNVSFLIMTITGLVMVNPAGALTWEKTSLDVSMAAGAGELVVEFPFKNEATSAVTIGDVEASCGCAEPTVAQKIVPAGGSGVVKVVYKPGDRVGPQSAQVIVNTDEGGGAYASLRLRINIQPAISLTPRLVRWTKEDAGVARTIEIKQLGATPVVIHEIKPVGEGLVVELKPAVETGVWQLTLKPKSVGQAGTFKVEIHAEVGGHTTTYAVFGVVR